MKTLVLYGDDLYESGKPIGKFQLAEGAKSDRMVIVEKAYFSDLKKVDPNVTESTLVHLLNEFTPSGSAAILCVLEGRLQMADMQNANGRIYPDSLWERILSDVALLDRIKRGEMLGEIDHPKDGETLLSRVGCMVTSIYRGQENAKEIRGRIVVFNNEKGKQVAAIIAGGGRVGASSRGRGSIVRREGVDFVQEDFELETWDLVHNPSTPDAYPRVESASFTVAGSRPEAKETSAMDRLKDLKERFARLRNKLTEATLHPQAASFIRDEIAAIQSALKDVPTTNESIAFASEVASELNSIKSSGYISESTKLPDGSGFAVATVETDDMDADDEEPEPEEESGPRPEKVEGVREWLQRTVGTPRAKDQKALAERCRTAYRRAWKVEGALKKVELDGIQQHVKSVMEAQSSLPKSPKIKATVEFTTNPGEAKIKESFKDLCQIAMRPNGFTATFTENKRVKVLETIAKLGACVVLLDERDAVYQECATKFNSLLEMQTAKALTAVNEAAQARASQSGLSAQLAATKQVIEQVVLRGRAAEGTSKEHASLLEAAYKLIDAVSEEAKVERLRGAVEALAASHPHLPGLAEALSRANSLREAVQITTRLVLESLPNVEREPVVQENTTRQDAGGSRFDEAIAKSEKAREKSESKGTKQAKFGDGRASVVETSHRVAARMDKISGR